MITNNQRVQIQNLIHNYRIGEKVTKDMIVSLCDSLTPTSYKTGKEITFGTYAVYSTGEQMKALRKDDLIWLLNQILEEEPLKLGFF